MSQIQLNLFLEDEFDAIHHKLDTAIKRTAEVEEAVPSSNTIEELIESANRKQGERLVEIMNGLFEGLQNNIDSYNTRFLEVFLASLDNNKKVEAQKKMRELVEENQSKVLNNFLFSEES